MKDKLPTLKELKKTWWWNRKDIRKNGVPGVCWKAVKEAARNYELLRRSPKGKEFTRNYLELYPDERNIIHALWMERDHQHFRFVHNPSQFEEKGWIPIYINQFRQWNLRLANSLLAREFIREIKALRQIQKVRARHPLKGKNNRGESWKLIEFLDRNLNGIGKLKASQRHTVSVAKKKADELAAEYKRTLAREKRKPNPLGESPCFYNDQNDSEESGL